MRHDHRAPTDELPRHGLFQAFVGHPERSGRYRRRLLIPLVVITLVAGAVAVANVKVLPRFLDRFECRAHDITRMVPPDGTLLGVNLDWTSENLAQYRKKLGHPPAVAVEFASIPYDKPTWSKVTRAATQVRQNGGLLLLSLEPGRGLGAVSDGVITRLGADLAAINASGVPVLLRFAHEMNGSWYPWGQQPQQYVRVFRRVAQGVHTTAAGTAMLWAPSYGGGYPFSGKYIPRRGSRNFTDLDTNRDGALTMADDMYRPYYPGDDAVDWVGISLYHWGNRYPWGENEIPERGRFVRMLTGKYSGTIGNERQVPDFYQVYGVSHRKPVAIPETAAFYAPSRSGASELAIKRAWWRQMFSERVHQQFPELKMINWFEFKKYEPEVKNVVDWRSGGSSVLDSSFRRDLPDWLRYADDVKACD